MRAVVALGNPGPEYADTRHNAGFLLADALAARWRLPRFKRHGRAGVSEGRVHGVALTLVKPLTYMNLSGDAVAPLASQPGFRVSDDLLVLVDEWALPVGTFRIRARGSSGGHNGLESVEWGLGSREYARLRIGIGPLPADWNDPADFVLSPFTREEREQLDQLMPKMAEAVECWLTEGVDTAMNRFNRRGQTSD